MVFYYEDCLSFSSCICWFFSARVLLCCSMSICYCFFISSYKILWSSSRRLYFSHFCRYRPNSSISPFCELIWLARFLSFSHHKFYNYSIFYLYLFIPSKYDIKASLVAAQFSGVGYVEIPFILKIARSSYMILLPVSFNASRSKVRRLF